MQLAKFVDVKNQIIMKKKQRLSLTKLKDRKSTQLWSDLSWDEVVKEANSYIEEQAKLGYVNPMVETEGGWDHTDYVIAVYKEETDEEFAARKLLIGQKEAKQREQKLEKLRKEAKELGVEIKES